MTKTEKIKENKKEFQVIVTYNKQGKDFQTIAEEIIIRKMNEYNEENKHYKEG